MDVSPVAHDELLVFSGAGLSIPPPTCLPSGVDLTEDVIDQFLTKRAAALVRDTWMRAHGLGVVDETLPRLEALIDAVMDHAPQQLAFELAPMATAAPNHLHDWCAGSVFAGGRHATVNLDTAIERAHRRRFARPVPADRLSHVHGRIDDLPAAGLTLGNVGLGLSEDEVQQLNRWLSEASQLVFIGYSGSDYFDVTPYFQSLDLPLNGLSTIWLQYADSDGLEEVSRDQWVGASLLEGLERSGSSVRVLSGRADSLLSELDGGLWADTDANEVPPSRAAPVSHPDVDQGVRGRISVQFAQSAGCPRITRDIGVVQDSRDPWMIEQHAQSLFDSGQFESASRVFESLLELVDDPARITERIAACLWAVGRNRRAFELLAVALDEASTPVSESVQLEMRIMQLHALRRARAERMGLAWARRSRCQSTFAAAVDLIQVDHGSPHRANVLPHLFNQLHVLASDLPVDGSMMARFQRDEASVRESFREAASLGGVANTRYRLLRESYQRGEDVNEERDTVVALGRLVGNGNVVYRASLMVDPTITAVEYPPSYHAKTFLQIGVAVVRRAVRRLRTSS